MANRSPARQTPRSQTEHETKFHTGSLKRGGLFPLRSTIILTGVGVLAIVLPLLLIKIGIIDVYTAHILTMGGVNAIMAMSVNMIVGITGQLSLGQAGFLAIGAYSCIFFNLDLGLPLPLAAVLAMLLTTLAGFLIGFPVLKLSGDYLAIVTLGFGEIIRVVFINLKALTGGPNGRQFTTVMVLNGEFAFVVVLVLLILVLALLQNFLRSSYGRAIMACREDEVAANANGISVFRYKMIGFVIASFIAGLGGSLYAMVVGFIKPDIAQFLRSIDFLIYVVLGGMGSMTGSIMAAYVLTYLQEFLRFLQDYRLLIYPLILIFVMLFRPQGLLGMKEFSFVGTFDRLLKLGKAAPAKPSGKSLS
jgi:branched-chain amino acid transport system permease protein